MTRSSSTIVLNNDFNCGMNMLHNFIWSCPKRPLPPKRYPNLVVPTCQHFLASPSPPPPPCRTIYVLPISEGVHTSYNALHLIYKKRAKILMDLLCKVHACWAVNEVLTFLLVSCCRSRTGSHNHLISDRWPVAAVHNRFIWDFRTIRAVLTPYLGIFSIG